MFLWELMLLGKLWIPEGRLFGMSLLLESLELTLGFSEKVSKVQSMLNCVRFQELYLFL